MEKQKKVIRKYNNTTTMMRIETYYICKGLQIKIYYEKLNVQYKEMKRENKKILVCEI